MNHQQLKSWEIALFGAVLFVPASFFAWPVLTTEWDLIHVRDEINSHDVAAIEQRLRRADANDILFRPLPPASSLDAASNVLGEAAKICDEAIVDVFLQHAGARATAHYLSQAELVHAIHRSADRCPQIGQKLRAAAQSRQGSR